MITVKISNTVLADPARMAALRQPLALARVMAEAVQERVQRRGVTVSTPKPYAEHTTRSTQGGEGGTGRIVTRTASGKKTQAGYVVSPEYATSAGLSEHRFRSSAEMHRRAGVKAGTYVVTGGMWSGMQVRSMGAGAVIEFAGVSLGGTSTRRVAWGRDASTGKMAPRRYTAGKRAGTVVMLKGKRVRNWEKGGIVFRSSRVAVLQPADYETRDMIDGFGAALFDAIRIVTTDTLTTADATVLPRTALARRFFEAIG